MTHNKLVYKDCSELPIFNFFELVKTRDSSWLLRDKASTVDKVYLEELVMDIMLEYNALSNNSKLLREYEARIDIDYTEAKYNFTKELISLYIETGEIEILLPIKGFGWVLNTAEHIDPQLQRISKSLIGLKNKLNIKKINFARKFQKQVKKDTPNFDVEKQCIYLESGIPLSYRIDIYNDSIKRYIHYNEILDNKNKALSNG